MIDAARHRAVDGRTHWAREDVALGHLALNITPEDEAERQPFVSADGRYVIAADARVDNRDELLPTLIQDGLVASTTAGNAEIILAAYRKWGRDCIYHVIGDFAFLVWDTVNRRAFGARDPMSMRPFFYRFDGRRLLVASEVKQILAVPGVARKLDERMAAAWLSVKPGAPSWTFFEGVNQLPGAHTLTADSGHCTVRRGWDFDPEHRIRYRTDDEYAEHFREILLDAARCRMRSRHPAGIFLSGGLDSVSAAAASGWILRNHAPEPTWSSMTAYAYRYEHYPECDERHVSWPVADHFGFLHEEVPSSIMVEQPALDGRWPVDGPVAGIYRSLQDDVLRRASQARIRQMYTGARGDNMMGAFIWDHLGLLLSGDLSEGVAEIGRYRNAYQISTFEALRRTLLRSIVSAATARSRAFRTFIELKRKHNALPGEARSDIPWLAREFVRRNGLDVDSVERGADRGWRGPREERVNAINDGFTLLGNVYRAQNYALHGIQYEDLWGDRRIAEFAAAVPQYVLNRTNDTKRITRMALSGILPDNVRRISQKIIPAKEGDHAMRQSRDSIAGYVAGMRLSERGLIREPELRQHVNAFFEGGELDASAWCALTLEAWLRALDM